MLHNLTDSSIVYDRKTDNTGKTEKFTKTWTLKGSINYRIDKFTYATGFGKRFVNTSILENCMEFDNGDWATGLAIRYDLPDLPWYE